jgi:hypothetical protein
MSASLLAGVVENALAVRIKSHWHKEDKVRSTEETAGAIAFSSWRIAMDKAATLYKEHFDYTSNQQRLDVIAEYLLFQVQIVDRLIHHQLSLEERQQLITSLANRLAEHVQENSLDLLGDGDYRSSFIEKLNQRSSEYAQLGFDKDGPTYPFMRHLGYEIQLLMGKESENRWVIDQVMDKDGPDIYAQLKRIVKNLS